MTGDALQGVQAGDAVLLVEDHYRGGKPREVTVAKVTRTHAHVRIYGGTMTRFALADGVETAVRVGSPMRLYTRRGWELAEQRAVAAGRIRDKLIRSYSWERELPLATLQQIADLVDP